MVRLASSYELTLSPSRGGAAGVYSSLRGAILSGGLAAGTRLPSSRQLASDYGVSRGTVVAAFEQLLSEGYLEARQGSGTRVSKVLPEALLSAMPAAAPQNGSSVAARVSRRGKALSQSPFGTADSLRIGVPFAPHVPALQDFPLKLWAGIAARQARSLAPQLLADGDARGLAALRSAVAEYLGGTRGVRCLPEQVIVLASVQQAADLAARLLLDGGDEVWFEHPGYAGALSVLRATGVVVRGVPVDDDGLDVQYALRRWPNARMAYVTPAHQAPLGMALSLPRRLTLLDWARRTRAWIFEDDYDSEYRYFGKPLPSLQSLDPTGPVLYAGCFSKTLFPGLRIAYLVVPESLVDAFSAARSVTSRYSPVLDQMILAEFMRDGHYARHLRQMRQLYGERREVFLQLLRTHLAGRLEPLDNPTGLNIACWLQGDAEEEAATKCAAAGLLVQPIGRYAVSRRPTTRKGLLLGFASLGLPTIRRAVPELARVLAA
jgi:GntR family transcriptional regulator / MocR family aminotransferase